MFILKVVKVLCFDTLLEVLILKNVKVVLVLHFVSVDSKWVNGWRHLRSTTREWRSRYIDKSQSTQTGTVLLIRNCKAVNGAIGGHGSLQKWKDLSCNGKSRGGEAHYSTGVMYQSGNAVVNRQIGLYYVTFLKSPETDR